MEYVMGFFLTFMGWVILSSVGWRYTEIMGVVLIVFGYHFFTSD